MRRPRAYPLAGVAMILMAVACDDPVGPQLAATDSCAAQPDPNSVVAFADANLEAEVRAELGLSAGDAMTCRLVGGMEALSAGNAGIVSLVGLQNLTAVRDLLLASNAISDLAPMSGLTALEIVDLQENDISDLGPLSGLDLLALSLTRNSISDIGPLASLDRMELLALDHNQISDIGAVAGMTNMLRLVLFNNTIQDLTPLANMARLDLLDVGQNPQPDITPLSGLGTLTVVGLDDTGITDIAALEELILLRLVVLDNNRNLTDIQPLIDNRGFGTRSTLWARETGVTCMDLQTLIDRGVTVLSDC